MKKKKRFAKKLRKKVRKESELGLVDEKEEKDYQDNSVLKDHYLEAKKLKKALVEEYEKEKVEEATECCIASNEYGEFLHQEEIVKQRLSLPPDCRENILSDLKLIHGIGPVREEKLKKKGFNTIKDLIDNKKWGDKATSFIENFEASEMKAIRKLLRWRPSSHPTVLRLASFFEEEDFAILDIETMGLSNQPAILLGLGIPGLKEIKLHQFLLKDIDQEIAALSQFLEKINEKSALLTFNGKSFDIPFIKRRSSFYGLEENLEHTNFDLYHFSQRAWGNRLPNCRLNTIEKKILGKNREIDIPSSMVPEFYKTYLEKRNPGPLIPILKHNKQDILNLSLLFQELQKEMIHGSSETSY